jgi:trehalose/maltose hydrolase-like predicted phosphorylase
LYELHITGDIAFAARQYFAATGDKDWLLNDFGGDLIYQAAQFWSSRAVYNNMKKQYEILNVLPPDEDAQPYKNNSVFTNAIAALSIQSANYISQITNKTVPPQWLDIASNLYFPFDNATQTFLEYEGFDLSKYSYSQERTIVLIVSYFCFVQIKLLLNKLMLFFSDIL